MLIGTKKDFEDKRQVQFKEAKELADEWSIPLFEVSCKTGEGVNEAVLMMTDMVYERYLYLKENQLTALGWKEALQIIRLSLKKCQMTPMAPLCAPSFEVKTKLFLHASNVNYSI